MIFTILLKHCVYFTPNNLLHLIAALVTLLFRPHNIYMKAGVIKIKVNRIYFERNAKIDGKVRKKGTLRIVHVCGTLRHSRST